MTPEEAIEQYEEALVDYRRAVQHRFAAWRPSKDIEAEIIVNGGFANIVIDGKNAEQREAQLRMARNLNAAWVDLDAEVRGADANKDMAIATMEMCRTFIAYETALANERASIGRKD